MITFILSCNLAFAVLDCEVKNTACIGNQLKVMGFSDYSNAHAEIYTENNYDYNLCCSDDSSTYTLLNTCDTELLYLSNYTDAHGQKPSETSYSYPVCLDVDTTDGTEVLCSFSTGTCITGKECLFTVAMSEGTNQNTNFHFGDCITDPYEEKFCCGFAKPPKTNTFDEVTDIASSEDLNSVNNFVLSKGSTRIEWNTPVNVETEDYDSNIVMGEGYTSINASSLDPSINSSANVTLYVAGCDNLQIRYSDTHYTTYVDIWNNGELCNEFTNPSCTNIKCSGNQITFTTEHFDGYSVFGSGLLSSGAVPEFHEWSIIISLIATISCIFLIRKNE